MTIDAAVRTQIVLGAVNAATAKLAALTSQAAGDRDALDRLPDLEALIAQVRRGDHRGDRPEILGVPADRRRARQQGVHRRDHRGGARSVLHPRPGDPADPAQPVPPRRRRTGPHRTHRQPRRPADGPHPGGLTGHRVALWIEEQTTGNGARKVRVIQHVKDLGRADDDRDTAGAA